MTAALLYLDANIVIAIVEGHSSEVQAIQLLAKAMDEKRLNCVTSELTLAEVLVKPFADQNSRYLSAYRTLLAGDVALKVVPVRRQTLEHSAKLRADSGGKLADSIHVATAALSGCTHFLSEDSRVKLVPPLEQMRLATLPQLLSSLRNGI